MTRLGLLCLIISFLPQRHKVIRKVHKAFKRIVVISTIENLRKQLHNLSPKLVILRNEESSQVAPQSQSKVILCRFSNEDSSFLRMTRLGFLCLVISFLPQRRKVIRKVHKAFKRIVVISTEEKSPQATP
ncbi:hypothetical protein DCO46_01630 [Flavobacterium sp. HTF]|nr:hypothetical protein DCO46_01630 [Flavobacterium sp. HTF]